MYNTHQIYTMRTNIDLDDTLLTQALQLTGAKTKREVVHLALGELVRRLRKRNLADLAGQIRFRRDFDHKALRGLRHGAG